jgi:hypothetical protein
MYERTLKYQHKTAHTFFIYEFPVLKDKKKKLKKKITKNYILL